VCCVNLSKYPNCCASISSTFTMMWTNPNYIYIFPHTDKKVTKEMDGTKEMLEIGNHTYTKRENEKEERQ
jgi:hypothetical protein